jgi:hypothetical protein
MNISAKRQALIQIPNMLGALNPSAWLHGACAAALLLVQRVAAAWLNGGHLVTGVPPLAMTRIVHLYGSSPQRIHSGSIRFPALLLVRIQQHWDDELSSGCSLPRLEPATAPCSRV